MVCCVGATCKGLCKSPIALKLSFARFDISETGTIKEKNAVRFTPETQVRVSRIVAGGIDGKIKVGNLFHTRGVASKIRLCQLGRTVGKGRKGKRHSWGHVFQDEHCKGRATSAQQNPKLESLVYVVDQTFKNLAVNGVEAEKVRVGDCLGIHGVRFVSWFRLRWRKTNKCPDPLQQLS